MKTLPAILARKDFFENLHVKKEGDRILLIDEQTGTNAFMGTEALLRACIEMDQFVVVTLDEEVELSLFPSDRDPKFRAVTIMAPRKIKHLMEVILDKVNMTRDNYQKLANILAEHIE